MRLTIEFNADAVQTAAQRNLLIRLIQAGLKSVESDLCLKGVKHGGVFAGDKQVGFYSLTGAPSYPRLKD